MTLLHAKQQGCDAQRDEIRRGPVARRSPLGLIGRLSGGGHHRRRLPPPPGSLELLACCSPELRPDSRSIDGVSGGLAQLLSEVANRRSGSFVDVAARVGVVVVGAGAIALDWLCSRCPPSSTGVSVPGGPRSSPCGRPYCRSRRWREAGTCRSLARVGVVAAAGFCGSCSSCCRRARHPPLWQPRRCTGCSSCWWRGARRAGGLVAAAAAAGHTDRAVSSCVGGLGAGVGVLRYPERLRWHCRSKDTGGMQPRSTA